MANSDAFWGAFLKSLSQGPLMNPDELDKSNALRNEVQAKQAELNLKAREQGMRPVPQTVDASHPVWGKIRQMFRGPSLQTAFEPDPSVSQYGQDPTGKYFSSPPGKPFPEGSPHVPPKEARKGMATQYKQQESFNKPTSPYLSYRKDYLEYMKNRLDYQKVRDVAKETGVQPKVLSMLQTNNMRADRALQRLSQDKMTWQDFNTVITDWQGIMQGGVPHQMQYADASFPNWKQKLAEWQTYVTSAPTETVPDEIKNYMKDVVSGLKTVDNNYLQFNADYVGKTLGSTISGYNEPGGLGETVQTGTKKLIKGNVLPGQSTGGGLPPDKQKRLEELRRKQAEGTLR